MENYVGQILDNRYEILEKIGVGGMAVVYKARCHRLNRLVAVKILKDELATDEEFRRRFHTESQAVAMLSHPNIVAVYDVSRSGNIEYIVMELIEGITLKQYINRKGVLNWKEALHFSTQITKALSHAHSRGIIHRDIKPHNIMILKDGSVKVADFGIARLLSTQNTLTQEALGSVHYISPEQAKGGHVDARSDLYSLGVVMYEMLTGQLPFVGDSAVSVAIQHISAIPLMPSEINPEVPEGLESITMHAMEPNVNARYTSADELLHDLDEFRKNPGIVFVYSSADVVSEALGTDEATKPVPAGEITRKSAEIASAHGKTVRATRKAEMTKAEYRKSQKRASKTSLLIGVFSIIVFLIVVFLFMWNTVIKDFFQKEEMLTTPGFVNMVYAEVINNPEYQAYNFEPSYASSETVAEGTIIDQDPRAGRPVAAAVGGILVKVTVSTGPAPEEEILMPDYVNTDRRIAKTDLMELSEQHGLNLQIVEIEQHSDITTGYIINTNPLATQQLTVGMTVTLIYSTGPEIETREVPVCTGVSLEVAEARLAGREFGVPTTEFVHDEAEPGIVIFQDIEAGKEVPKGTVLKLQVSKGPKETPSPSPTESQNPTDSPSPSPSGGGDPTDNPETSPPGGDTGTGGDNPEGPPVVVG